MITEWNIYLLTRMDYIQGLVTTLAVIICFASVIVCILGYAAEYPEARRVFWRRLLPVALVFLFASVLVPNSKEYAAIKVIPAIAADENVHDIGTEIIDLGHAWLEELHP